MQLFAGQGGEPAFGSDPAILNVLWVSGGALGFAALGVRLRCLRLTGES